MAVFLLAPSPLVLAVTPVLALSARGRRLLKITWAFVALLGALRGLVVRVEGAHEQVLVRFW
jgi:hypothetical protein